jgi:hypothetical protein
MATKLTLRLDARVGEHFHCTFFASGAVAGKLCLREPEYQELLGCVTASPDNADPEFAELARIAGIGRSCTREATHAS